ncbi:hypothetical protein ACFPU1_12605 [Thalassorhabdus alkalitolerans]|uniref:50S ribosomal protein L29 n=1 Tax=Thalassorhabdus alkalitolerans TaxID=2282697 RepID=A0ABW0YNA6_9BACI|nr:MULTISPECIES: hypothetical protein [Bacillaceae]
MNDYNYLNKEEQKELHVLQSQLEYSQSDSERKQIITRITLLLEKAKVRERRPGND